MPGLRVLQKPPASDSRYLPANAAPLRHCRRCHRRPALYPYRAVALQQAQQTLRQLTGETFKSVYRPQLEQALNQRLQSVSQQAKSAQQRRDQYPQNSPEYQSWEQERELHKKLVQLIYNAKTPLKQLSQVAYPFAAPIYWAAFTCQGLR